MQLKNNKFDFPFCCLCSLTDSGAKAKDLQISDSSATSLMVELNYLRNHSDVIRAKTEAQAALVTERANHLQLKLQVKQKMAITDILQGRIEILEIERANILTNRSTLGKTAQQLVFGGRSSTASLFQKILNKKMFKSCCFFVSYRNR